ncbi:MAG: NUDIX hydrolase [Dehalococcoidia bacterium]
MEPRQAFRAYDHAEAAEETADFCLACGSPLTDRHDGGRPRRACTACGYIRYRVPAPGVSVLIVDGERFVLCRRGRTELEGGKWCLPCGYIEYDEDFLTAAVREAEEETGLIIEIASIISVVSNFLQPNVHTVVTVLLARATGGELRPGDDTDMARWHSWGNELPVMAFEADTHIIQRYFATRPEGAPVDKTLG